jgi:hypothetical protein
MDAKAEGGWHLRKVIIAAIISGTIVELVLWVLLSLMGLSEGSTRVLNEPWRGLHALTPWRLAIGYWEFYQSAQWPNANSGIALAFAPIFELIGFLIELIRTEPWPAALVDVIQLVVGAFFGFAVFDFIFEKPPYGLGGGALKGLVFVISTLFSRRYFHLWCSS